MLKEGADESHTDCAGEQAEKVHVHTELNMRLQIPGPQLCTQNSSPYPLTSKW